jgi:endonuclease-3
MRQVEEAVRPYPKAALFELAEEGFKSPFELLIACIISIRTLDEVMLPTARRLFTRARTPEAILAMTPEAINAIIGPCSFHKRKAQQIHAITQRVVEEYNSKLPCDEDILLSFEGVGPKCAHLVLGIACGEPQIAVDIHVHRVTNRWGYVRGSTPEKTMEALAERLPQHYWIEINRLLVPFGKHICTGNLPRCSICPILDMCQQIGVTRHR